MSLSYLKTRLLLSMPCGGLRGGDSSSSSSSQQTTNTTNVDKRQVVNSGGVGATADNSTINITSSSSDPAVLQSALDAIKTSDATNGQGFQSLLGLADHLFTAGGNILQQTANTTEAQVAALTTAQNDQKGSLDQKTLLIGGALVVAALYVQKR